MRYSIDGYNYLFRRFHRNRRLQNQLKAYREKLTEYLHEESIEKLNDKNKNNSVLNSEDYTNQNKNLTKQIEYIASNKRGDTFKIFAKDGQTNLENSNILELNFVNGTIFSTEKNEIYIISDNAKYNYENYNSSFFNNVKINFDDKIILCDNLDFSFNDNIAVGYGNVTVKNENSIMNADSISLNIKTKDIVINSKNKVNIKVE